MRVSWIASGAILIILAVILYMLRAAFSFLPGTIITYYWVIPTIFFLIGIIVLLFGLILPEHRRQAVYYHREPRRTEQYVRERPPTYIKEQHVEQREEPGTYRTEAQQPPTTRAEPPRTTETTTTTRTTTPTQPLPTYETVGQERQTPTPTTTTTGHTEVIEETHEEKKIRRTT